MSAQTDAARLTELLKRERLLATGDGDRYRAMCAPEAIFVLPGMVLNLEQCAAAMDDSPGWDTISITDGQLVPINDGAEAVAYTFEGRRGETTYRASLTSVYRTDGEPVLLLHQHTPLPEA
ncbi:nuclear transport factor 2 family protein [Bogoriella caseilytica]|uniref:Uncharacterized protein DUF4440 n=1 Tax=Bogoriella caseilytica TaxID=56055 RepID=A0A3N2BCK3_9MICO|nr:nuclear transport factor 2 family protein [Bogoriella caseilytica]ROR72997.1 uncharacterized protein DUF4440 [Bogoriella caseilytica]